MVCVACDLDPCTSRMHWDCHTINCVTKRAFGALSCSLTTTLSVSFSSVDCFTIIALCCYSGSLVASYSFSGHHQSDTRIEPCSSTQQCIPSNYSFSDPLCLFDVYQWPVSISLHGTDTHSPLTMIYSSVYRFILKQKKANAALTQTKQLVSTNGGGGGHFCSKTCCWTLLILKPQQPNFFMPFWRKQ